MQDSGLFIFSAYDKYMDTSDILSFCLCTNSENGQMYGTRQLEKNHAHTETERMINFIFSKNHYVTNPVHGLEISCVLHQVSSRYQITVTTQHTTWLNKETDNTPHTSNRQHNKCEVFSRKLEIHVSFHTIQLHFISH